MFCLFILAIGIQGPAGADNEFLQNCPLKKGDPLLRVKEFYRISAEPKLLEKLPPGVTGYFYHFPEYGVYIYFNGNKNIIAMQFGRPFSGKIERISVGDAKEYVASIHGEPVKKAQGLLDVDLIESRKKRKLEIVESLPDPSPKDQIRKAFLAIDEVNSLPVTFSTAWVFKSREGANIRYDIGSTSNKVQTIMSDNGTKEPAKIKNAPSPIMAISQQSIQDFFRRGDDFYTNGNLLDYMAQYSENYVINAKDKVILDGKRVREKNIFTILTSTRPRLSETIINSVSIAENGQNALAKITTTERYRKQVGVMRTVSKVVSEIAHNFAIIDKQDVHLALIDGTIRITRTDIHSRVETENSGE